MQGEADITIKPDGTVEFLVAGIQGTACEELTEALVHSVGEVEEQHFTEEYELENPDYVEVGE